ncbi:hypothetical protein FHS07_001881 [Microbacterium proteolyticum]|uniref:Uncharacterized protein n=1 Tax=Microbacterium proteolyticum TaxID=1572644 RepID=A0A7W5GFT7_9MICO|nr:hypothetical protein [Microbacterium proteolyticum]MBB3158185.1 hypothetical protein [Microbacterium proteolyticum]
MDGNSKLDDEEIALEHWDDDGGTEAAMPVLTLAPRSQSPHQIAHFPPL